MTHSSNARSIDQPTARPVRSWTQDKGYWKDPGRASVALARRALLARVRVWVAAPDVANVTKYMPPDDPFSVLGVRTDASVADVKIAYRSLGTHRLQMQCDMR